MLPCSSLGTWSRGTGVDSEAGRLESLSQAVAKQLPAHSSHQDTSLAGIWIILTQPRSSRENQQTRSRDWPQETTERQHALGPHRAAPAGATGSGWARTGGCSCKSWWGHLGAPALPPCQHCHLCTRPCGTEGYRGPAVALARTPSSSWRPAQEQTHSECCTSPCRQLPEQGQQHMEEPQLSLNIWFCAFLYCNKISLPTDFTSSLSGHH